MYYLFVMNCLSWCQVRPKSAPANPDLGLTWHQLNQVRPKSGPSPYPQTLTWA